MELKELYQEIIIDHNRSPRNFREIADADRMIEGYNPLCGDKLRLYLKLDGDKIADASFVGSGCAISTASASLMTEAVKGKTIDEAEALFSNMHAMLTQQPGYFPEKLGKLDALAGVKDYPSRIKCASLCWHSLHTALLESGKQSVTTE